MTICILLVVFNVLLDLNYNVDRVDFLHLHFKEITIFKCLHVYVVTASLLITIIWKTVYSGSCVFLVTRKDLTFEFLKNKISFEDMVKCVIFCDMLV